jgi:hypothetical protein
VCVVVFRKKLQSRLEVESTSVSLFILELNYLWNDV